VEESWLAAFKVRVRCGRGYKLMVREFAAAAVVTARRVLSARRGMEELVESSKPITLRPGGA
jgi:hypothetical protein